MSVIGWIRDHLESDKTLYWLAANGGKFLIEILASALFSLPFVLILWAIVAYSSAEFPLGAAGPLALFVLVTAGAYIEHWNCQI